MAESSYTPRPGLMVREVEGELLILDTASNRIHQLNETAALVWRMCGDAASPAQIAAALANRFDVEEDVAMRDVNEMLAQLRALGLLDSAPR